MDWKTDETLKALIEKGKESGSLTYDELNRALPEGADPERLPELLELLEQHGITPVDAEDEDDAPAPADRPEAVVEAVVEAFGDTDGDGRHIDVGPLLFCLRPGCRAWSLCIHCSQASYFKKYSIFPIPLQLAASLRNADF